MSRIRGATVRSIHSEASNLSQYDDSSGPEDASEFDRARVSGVEVDQLALSLSRKQRTRAKTLGDVSTRADEYPRRVDGRCRVSLCPKLRDETYGIPRILFRVWSETSGGLNTPLQFHASDTSSLDSHTTQMLEESALMHIEGKKDFGQGIGSPFISTTPSLVWVLHKMLRTAGDVHLAVIDGNATAAATSWWFANDLRTKTWPWYCGTYEWLIGTRIDPSALLGPSTSLRSLKELCRQSPYVKDLLQLSTIKNKCTLGGARKELDLGGLTAATGLGIGHFASFIRPSFKDSPITDPLLKALVTTVLFSFGETCDERVWMRNEDFVDGVLRGLVQGTKHASTPFESTAAVFMGVGIRSDERSRLDHLLAHPCTPPSRAIRAYPSPVSMKRKDTTSFSQHDDDDDDALSDVFGSDEMDVNRVPEQYSESDDDSDATFDGTIILD